MHRQEYSTTATQTLTILSREERTAKLAESKRNSEELERSQTERRRMLDKKTRADRPVDEYLTTIRGVLQEFSEFQEITRRTLINIIAGQIKQYDIQHNITKANSEENKYYKQTANIIDFTSSRDTNSTPHPHQQEAIYHSAFVKLLLQALENNTPGQTIKLENENVSADKIAASIIGYISALNAVRAVLHSSPDDLDIINSIKLEFCDNTKDTLGTSPAIYNELETQQITNNLKPKNQLVPR